jgi:regulator of cell morphogenesis and NO signaling
MEVTPTSTVRDMVTADFRAAAVFHGYGIDFCCGGRKTLEEACRERSLCLDEVLREVGKACRLADSSQPQYADLDTEALIAHIVDVHHEYVRRAMPALVAHVHKVAKAHGTTHPELLDVALVFDSVVREMTLHMGKEEGVLFPYISRAVQAAEAGGEPPVAPFGSVDNPIRMMEEEHESAGSAMALIRELTDDFTPPDDACTTYRICLQELAAFERDLHEHVHLENNILFPRAQAMAEGRRSA